jgi:hypothetical protein
VRSAYLGLPSEEAADEKTVIPGLDTDQPGVAHAKAEG